MKVKQKVIKALGPAEAFKHEPRFWSIYQDPWYKELGFGASEAGAWLDAWRRYSRRKALVARAADYTPRSTNH